MKKLLFLMLAGVAAFKLYNDHVATDKAMSIGRHDQVIMYALTTCGFCKEKARLLQEQGIAYVEYDIDVDSTRKNELNAKLAKAGFPPRGYGTPIFDVHGVMLPNNPELAEIQKILREDQAQKKNG